MYFHETFRSDYRSRESGQAVLAGGRDSVVCVPERTAHGTVTGYRYTVALPDKGLDKINVRIDGDQQMDAPDSFVEVRFTELEPYLYWSGGEYQLGARAKGISAVNTSKG